MSIAFFNVRCHVWVLIEIFTDDAEALAFDGLPSGHAEVGRWLGEMLVERGRGALPSPAHGSTVRR